MAVCIKSPSRRDAASVDARTGTPAAAAATHAATMHARTNAPALCPILRRLVTNARTKACTWAIMGMSMAAPRTIHRPGQH